MGWNSYCDFSCNVGHAVCHVHDSGHSRTAADAVSVHCRYVCRKKFPCDKRPGAFWLCSAVLFALFCVPYLPQTFKVNDTLALTLNGAFESFCIVIVFPILVWLGASGRASDGVSDKVCGFLGDISYPLYLIHYPFMYLFYSWLIKTEQYTLMETWSVVLVLYASCVLVAFICLRLYDIPVRNWLKRRMG